MKPEQLGLLEQFEKEVKELKARISDLCEQNNVHLGAGYYDNEGHQKFWFPWEGVDEEDTCIEQLHHEFPEIFQKEPLLNTMGGWSNDRTCMPIDWVQTLILRAYEKGYVDGSKDDEALQQRIADMRQEMDEP